MFVVLTGLSLTIGFAQGRCWYCKYIARNGGIIRELDNVASPNDLRAYTPEYSDSIPYNLSAYHKLHSLSLEYRDDTAFTFDISTARSLRYFELNSYHIKNIPEEIQCLKKLRALSVFRGKSYELETDYVFLRALKGLKWLHIYDMKVADLNSLASILIDLPKLRTLHITGDFNQLAPKMHDLKQLKYLNIRSDNIAQSELNELYASLKVKPDDGCQCEKLPRYTRKDRKYDEEWGFPVREVEPWLRCKKRKTP